MADYWIKWYHEILDDPKMATLPDRLWRRFSELCLIAGKVGGNEKSGQLPDTRSLAWMLRMNTDELQLDLIQLSRTDLIEAIPNGWIIPKFNERQSAVPGHERTRQSRERKQKQQYDGSVTIALRSVTQNRTETETEHNRGLDAPQVPEKPELKIVLEVTGLLPDYMHEDEVIRNVQAVHNKRRLPLPELVAYLKEVYEAWCNGVTSDGRKYNPTNWKWLEWAITGYSPKPATLAAVPKTRKLTGPNGEVIEERL